MDGFIYMVIVSGAGMVFIAVCALIERYFKHQDELNASW